MGLPSEVLVAVMEVVIRTGHTTCGSSLATMAPEVIEAVVMSKEAEVVVMATPEDMARTAGRIWQAAEAAMEITLGHSLLLGARRRYTFAIRRASNLLNQQTNLPPRRRRRK